MRRLFLLFLRFCFALQTRVNLLRVRVKERCGLEIHFETKEFEPTLRENAVPTLGAD